jgi:hypothetical protein
VKPLFPNLAKANNSGSLWANGSSNLFANVVKPVEETSPISPEVVKPAPPTEAPPVKSSGVFGAAFTQAAPSTADAPK